MGTGVCVSVQFGVSVDIAHVKVVMQVRGELH
jgi:hypothetical protein